MDWTDWAPQENVIDSIHELLQEALIPDNEIQRNVQQKLNSIQHIPDFSYYLLFILSNSNYPEDIRNLSGILLKNNISAVYDSITYDNLLRLRHESIQLLQDHCKDIRLSISNVLVTLAKDSLSTWPQLIPQLMNLLDVPNECNDIVLSTLFKITEEHIRNRESDEEIISTTKKIFSKLNKYLTEEECNLRTDIIRSINQFLQDYFKISKQSLDMALYLKNLMRFADSEENDLQKYICHAFVIYLENREDSLLPHIHQIMQYLLNKIQHEDMDVALQACEFWFTTTKLPNCTELICSYLDKLIPILLSNMKYSHYELQALKDCLGNDCSFKDLATDIHRFHNKDDEGGYQGHSDEEDNLNDDVDDFYIGWTLRKCSATTLDAIAVKCGESLLPTLIPCLNDILTQEDYLIKESGILALGAVAEGCTPGLKQFLPHLINYLISSMDDDHSIIRVITCWTLSRYVNWIINSEPLPQVYFIPVMTILLKHFSDDNKRVQRSALSAFCIFQEEAQTKLIPYIDFLLEAFQEGFRVFHYRSLYLLYDVITVLAQSVGNQLGKNEYTNKLMPPLMQNFISCENYSDDSFLAVMECLANVIPSLGITFLPYSALVFGRCLQIINDTMGSGSDFSDNPDKFYLPDREAMNVALDVLYSMALGLKNHFIKYVTNSNLVFLLRNAMQEKMVLIRQTAIALYGELVMLCFPLLTNNINEYIPIIIHNLDERYEGVCNNAAWVIGKLCTVMGSDIESYLPHILASFTTLIKSANTNRAMYQTVAISFCIIFYVCSNILVNDLDFILKMCCKLIRNVKDSEEKDLAFRGLCKIIMYNPNFGTENFLYFCDAVASWNNIRYDLKENIRSIIFSFKEQYGEINWNIFYQECPEPLKIRLFNLYGV